MSGREAASRRVTQQKLMSRADAVNAGIAGLVTAGIVLGNNVSPAVSDDGIEAIARRNQIALEEEKAKKYAAANPTKEDVDEDNQKLLALSD